MNFKKLALAAAVAVAPMSALALEPMQDDALSGVTGQDGISIGITTNNLNLNAIVHDKDGLTSISGDAGAIVIEGLQVNTNSNAINIDIDADGNAGTPVLNVAVSIPTGTEIQTGNMKVAASGGASAGSWTTSNTTSTVLSNAIITLGSTTLNVQLGNEDQGSMIALNTTITGGINIAESGILDANSGGGIYMDNLLITDSGGTDLSVDADVDVDASGMQVPINQFGDATNGAELRITNQRLGAYDYGAGTGVAALGDVQITGLNLNGTTVSIAGH